MTLTSQHHHHHGSPKKTTLSKTLILITISAIITGSTTHAQAPQSTRRMGYTTLDDGFYIQGGFIDKYTDQFSVLDLSTSWSTSSAPWKSLKDGYTTSHFALAPISSTTNGGSKGSVLAIGGPNPPTFFNTYDVNSDAWTAGTVKNPYPNLEGHAAASDPNTGLVYIIGGYTGGNATVYNDVTIYDPKSKTVASQQDTKQGSSLTDVGAVWVSSRNSILTFGGSRVTAAAADVQGLGSGDLNEYDPSTRKWKTMSTTGDIPPPRLDHCMAASEDGKKVVVFGGTPDRNTYYNTLYILDVPSGVWKQGAGTSVARTRLACTFRSFQFIVWGGSSGTASNTILNNLPLVYNLNQDKWLDNYNADEEEKKSPIGAIVGSVIGVLVIAGVAGFFLFKRNKRRQQERKAFYSDAAAAAAISRSESDADNIKVSVSDDTPGAYNTGYGNYANVYPLGNVGSTDSFGADHYYQQHPISTPGGSEKYLNPFSPAPSNYYPPTSLQSPEAAYLHTYDSNNPFISPEDYQSAMQTPHTQYTYPPPPTSPWPTNNYVGSPSAGGRSPQVIVNSNDSGYVPPPPLHQ